MKYLKLFDTETNYLAYRDDKNSYLKPNVSLCDDKGGVYYNFTPPPDFNGHDYVDLGLPSGTKWAAQNVGARKPSEAGLYFQWGDTQGYTLDQVGNSEGKKRFASDWSDYKWRLSGDSDSNVAFTKYTTSGATLDLEDDAAHVNMGGDWHMPTPAQIQELLDYTDIFYSWDGYIRGAYFTSKKDHSKDIFIPATGNLWDGIPTNDNYYAFLWSSILYVDGANYGQSLYIKSDDGEDEYDPNRCELEYVERCNGQNVRGVVG